jgi:hypothetical protein
MNAAENRWRNPLPTDLPHRRRANEKRSLVRTVFDVLFNGALIVSALILTFIVLVRQEQYAFGRQESPAQMVQQDAAESTGESQVFRPSN